MKLEKRMKDDYRIVSHVPKFRPIGIIAGLLLLLFSAVTGAILYFVFY